MDNDSLRVSVDDVGLAGDGTAKNGADNGRGGGFTPGLMPGHLLNMALFSGFFAHNGLIDRIGRDYWHFLHVLISDHPTGRQKR